MVVNGHATSARFIRIIIMYEQFWLFIVYVDDFEVFSEGLDIRQIPIVILKNSEKKV